MGIAVTGSGLVIYLHRVTTFSSDVTVTRNLHLVDFNATPLATVSDHL